MTHLDYDRQSPVWRHWVRELSRGHALIRYDERGCGLSDRQFDGAPTLDTYVGDLAAVVDAAGLERFALFGVSGGGPTAIEYAVRNPERVSHLVLYGTPGRYRRGERDTEQSRLLIDLMRVGWGGAVPAFRQVFSSFFIPSAGEEQKRWYDEMPQASSSGEMAARLWLSNTQVDISETARRITQPALVLHARHDSAVPYEEGRRLASLLPGRSLRDARDPRATRHRSKRKLTASLRKPSRLSRHLVVTGRPVRWSLPKPAAAPRTSLSPRYGYEPSPQRPIHRARGRELDARDRGVRILGQVEQRGREWRSPAQGGAVHALARRAQLPRPEPGRPQRHAQLDQPARPRVPVRPEGVRQIPAWRRQPSV